MEKISRSIFSPININAKTGNLKSNAFKPPKNSEDISVNRVDYSKASFCKKHGLENQSQDREFFGLAILSVENIITSICSIIFSPIRKPKHKKNPYHSDIKIGFKVIAGEPLPAEYSSKVNSLKEKSRVFIDNDLSTSEWKGEEII